MKQIDCENSVELGGSDLRLEIASQRVPVERISGAKTEKFAHEYLSGPGRPVVVTDAIDSWPAKKLWSFDHLAERAGSHRVLAMDDLVKPSLIRAISLREYALYCTQPFFSRLAEIEGERPFYITHPLIKNPELLDEIRQPDFINNVYLQLTGEMLNWYHEVFGWIYIGPANTVTALHVDHYMTHTWSAQVVGRKRFLLFSPEDLASIPDPAVRAHLMTDVFQSQPISLQPRRAPVAHEAVVGPGETVVFPAGWAHQVVALEPSISVSYNFVTESNFIPHVMMISRKLPQWAKKINSARFRMNNDPSWDLDGTAIRSRNNDLVCKPTTLNKEIHASQAQ